MDVKAPLKDIPACWNDDKRMNSLFAPFRKKEMNPVDWESKMKFWHSVIEKWCFERNKATVSVQLVQTEFKRNDRTPACIATVFQELCRTGELRSKSEFLSLDCNQSWTGWAVDSLVKTPVNWSLNKLKNYWYSDTQDIQPQQQYIHIPFIKAKANQLYNESEVSEQKLLSFKDISDILCENQVKMCEESVACLVQYLALQQLAVVQTVADTKLVKILKGDSDKSQTKEITQADLAIFRLEQNKAILMKNIEHLQSEKEKCLVEAKAFLNKGLEASAKSCLRKKKQLEKCIDKRTVALDNLESLLDSLHNTVSDTKVVDAYKVGLTALKQTFKSSGLSEDDVFETMSQLQEMNEMQEEIQQAISQPIGGVTDEDLEKELDQILSEHQTNKIELPDVPTNSLDSLLPDTMQINKKQKPRIEAQALS